MKPILFVSNSGISGSKHREIWTYAKTRFDFQECIVLTASHLIDELLDLIPYSVTICEIKDEFGGDNYISDVIELVRTVADSLRSAEKAGRPFEEIVWNSTGGTEKQSLIMGDALKVIKMGFKNVTSVWARKTRMYNEIIYHYKPNIPTEEIYKKYFETKIPEIIREQENEEFISNVKNLLSSPEKEEFLKTIGILDNNLILNNKLMKYVPKMAVIPEKPWWVKLKNYIHNLTKEN